MCYVCYDACDLVICTLWRSAEGETDRGRGGTATAKTEGGREGRPSLPVVVGLHVGQRFRFRFRFRVRVRVRVRGGLCPNHSH